MWDSHVTRVRTLCAILCTKHRVPSYWHCQGTSFHWSFHKSHVVRKSWHDPGCYLPTLWGGAAVWFMDDCHLFWTSSILEEDPHPAIQKSNWLPKIPKNIIGTLPITFATKDNDFVANERSSVARSGRRSARCTQKFPSQRDLWHRSPRLSCLPYQSRTSSFPWNSW